MVEAGKSGALRRARAGISTAQMLAIVGGLALLSFLMQVSTGEVELSALMPAKQASSKKSGKSKKSAFTIIGSPAKPSTSGMPGFTLTGQDVEDHPDQVIRKTHIAFSRMFPDDAALVLSELPPEEAAEILAGMKARYIAPILEEARKDIAAKWAQILMAPPKPSVSPADMLVPPGNSSNAEGDNGADELPGEPAPADPGSSPDPGDTGNPISNPTTDPEDPGGEDPGEPAQLTMFRQNRGFQGGASTPLKT